MPEDPPNEPNATAPSNASSVEQFEPRLRWIPSDPGRAVLWLVAIATVAGLLYVGWRFVGTVVVGLFVYYVTRPVFRRINTRLESRTVAVAVTLVTAVLPLLFIIGWAFAILVGALTDLVESDVFEEFEILVQPYLDITALLADFGRYLEALVTDPARLTDLQFDPALGEIAETVFSSFGVAFNAGINGFIVLILVFYLLRDDYRISRWARSTFLEDKEVLETYFMTVDVDLHNVYFGNILNALFTGVLAAVVYTLLNVVAPQVTQIPEAAFLGLLVGVASLIPVIGIKIVTWPVGAYLLGRALWLDPQALWFPVVFFLISFVVVDYIPDQLLRPYVSGRTLHVGAVMLAYTVGPLLFGWYGIFLAPLLFVMTFEFGRIIFPWLLDPEKTSVASPSALHPPEEGTEPVETTSTEEAIDEQPKDTSADRRPPDIADEAKSSEGE
ncbi:permease [Halorubrum coriense DSM 10284]|uniref:Permease n=1 Tax=Halorubrum coriense DSM 10284 TaxID=1227466 RepID=M0EBI6_9EURY|nr:AI-2E family transporter [Halorubrum coriense]ELZ45120.1 permease [Halorubrum coriense DSM 10284]